MRKQNKILFSLLIFVIALVCISCSSKEEKPETVAETFLKQHYSFSEEDTINWEVNEERTMEELEEELEEKLQEQYGELALEDCIKTLMSNRYYFQMQELYEKENSELTFENATITFLSEGKTDNIVKNYNYECNFKSENTSHVAKGRLSVEQQGDTWKVQRFRVTSVE